jgi:dihydropteroate synthase
MKTINCKGRIIDFEECKVMGILNLTPDSFYDGSQNNQNISEIIQKVANMVAEGLDFLDVGAYSSRPGASFVSEEEELSRLIPILEEILISFPNLLISIDTFRAKVAEETLEIGAAMINDISSGSLDKKMHETVCDYRVPYISMHMQGTPNNMQQNPSYEDINKELIFYFSELRHKLFSMGLNDLIIDPGFGFGKTIDQNYEILSNLGLYQSLDLPVLAGVSRKSMLYKPLNISPKEALVATSAAHMIALEEGANILRVHDVQAAKQCCQVFNLSKSASA